MLSDIKLHNCETIKLACYTCLPLFSIIVLTEMNGVLRTYSAAGRSAPSEGLAVRQCGTSWSACSQNMTEGLGSLLRS